MVGHEDFHQRGRLLGEGRARAGRQCQENSTETKHTNEVES